MTHMTFCELYSSAASAIANLCALLAEDAVGGRLFELEAYNPNTMLADAEPQFTNNFAEFLDFIADTTEQGHSYYVVTVYFSPNHFRSYTCDLQDNVLTCTYSC